MGCDIHLFVEKRRKGKWEPADQWKRNKYAEHEGERELEVPYKKKFYSGRNYSLFSILANVRNGFGFAGCDTGDGFKPIAAPRGLPLDVTSVVKAESDHWGVDGHSHSWFLLAEIFEYDWTQVTKCRGIVSAAEYWEWNQWRREQGECPESYCGGISGGDIKHISEEEMKELLKSYKNTAGVGIVLDQINEAFPKLYCQVEWDETYYQSCRRFWSDTIPRLLRVGKPEDVRLVFWFDN